jgi:hypothetical protein
MKRNRDESLIQQAIVKHFRNTYEGRICAVANGGWRDPLEAVRLKAEGVDAGHPDLIIYSPKGVFLMEVKRPWAPGRPKGVLSAAQKEFAKSMASIGFDRLAVVWALEEAVSVFKTWRLPEKGTPVRTIPENETWF